MANFNIQITNLGRALQAKAQTGTQLVFTRMRIGSGNLSGQQIVDLTNLITPQKWLTINKSVASSSGTHTLGAPLSNADITAGFYFREWGIFAQDPDVGEILYSYGNVGAGAEYISAGGGSDVIEKQLDAIAIIGNASNVSAVIDESLVFPSLADFNAHLNDNVKHITAAERTNWNAKETTTGAQTKATAAQNAAISAAATDATTKANAVQANLTTHDNNTTKHITAAERTAWNAKQAALGYVPENAANKNVASGYAGLDSNRKILPELIPDSIIGQVEYQGTWNGATNTPTLPDASSVKGHYYVVSVAGSYASVAFDIGDWIISNGSVWQKVNNTDAVSTVFGRSGNVVAATGDYTWNQINKSVSSIADITTRNLSDLTQTASHRTVTDTEKSTWNAKASTAVATTSANGLMSSTDKSKLDGVTAGAQPNPGVATTSNNGLMSAADKAKLDGVATGANNYTHPSSHPPSIITQDANNRFVTDAEKATWNAKETTSGAQAKVDTHAGDTVKHITAAERTSWNAKASTSAATTSAAGLMSAADKSKLDGVAAGAQVNAVTSVAGKTGAVTLAKGDVGLGNVDNVKQATKSEFDAHVASVTTQFADTKQRLIDGLEYMYFAHDKIRTGQGITLVASGDSTTFGVSITDTEWLIHKACKNILNKNGVRFVTAHNQGHSGMSTPHWQSTYLTQDLALNPDIYILRWGFNDGAHLPKTERLQVYTNALRGGLATLRAAKSVQQMSVVLMMPNSGNDTDMGRDAEWFKQIYPVIKQAARDFQCTFVDTYHYLLDSTNITWQDAPMAGKPNVHIHPLNTGNAWITSLLADALIPESLRKNGIVNRLGADEEKHVSNPPSSYPLGISILRTQSTGGWPNDGMVTTHHSMDGIVFQINSGLYAQANEGYSVRRGLSVNGSSFGGIGNDAWAPWIHLKNSESYKNLTLQNGWVNVGGTAPTAQYMLDSSGNVHIKAAIHSGTVTNGTVIATLPAGYRPSSDTFFPIVANGAFGYIEISWNGNIIARNVHANRTDFGRIVYKAEQ